MDDTFDGEFKAKKGQMIDTAAIFNKLKKEFDLYYQADNNRINEAETRNEAYKRSLES